MDKRNPGAINEIREMKCLKEAAQWVYVGTLHAERCQRCYEVGLPAECANKHHSCQKSLLMWYYDMLKSAEITERPWFFLCRARAAELGL